MLAGQTEPGEAGGELGASSGEADVAEAHQHETHAGRRSVDGGDDRFAEPEREGVVVLEVGSDARAGSR